MSWLDDAEVQTAEQREAEQLEQATNQVRTKRDKLIAATDYMLLPDYPNKPSGLHEYRQALRNVPQQESFPFSVEWPQCPIQ